MKIAKEKAEKNAKVEKGKNENIDKTSKSVVNTKTVSVKTDSDTIKVAVITSQNKILTEID
jgi:hypothetical protein